ncbi:glycosyltransferase family 4 protein [Lutibacter sp.]
MHIAIASPSDKSYISSFLPNEDINKLPNGYDGAIFIGTIIQELLKQGYTVTAITTSVDVNDDYQIKEFSYKNFTWVVVPSRPHSVRMNGSKLGTIVDFFSYEISQLSNAIKKSNPHIVHAHWSYEFAGAALKSGYPNLITVHDNAFQILRFFKNFYRFGRLLMSEVIVRKATFASTVSPYMLPYVKKRCKNVKVIPNPVPIKLNEQEVRLLINKRIKTFDTPKIIMVNNGWNQLKNGKIGLIAFNNLRKQFPKAELHLFGGGSEIGGLAEQEAKSLDIHGIIYHGTVSNKKLFAELKTSHLFIHPAIEESFGVVLIEAMSLGIPTIGGANSGAVPWVIDDKNLLVDVTDAFQLKNKMEELLISKKVYSKYSLQCYKNVVSRFSSKEVTNSYLIYYNEILETD